MDIYELYGRLSVKHETEIIAHQRTVDVLRQLKAGTITLDRLTVTDDNAWTIAPKAEAATASSSESNQ